MKKSLIIAATIGLFVGYFALLTTYGLLEPDEGRYAAISREMLISGDYLVPTANGIDHFQKPPVAYWCIAASLKIFGNNELGARMPNVLAGLCILGLTRWIGRLWFSPQVGRFAFWMLAASLEFFMLSRTLTPDMIMTLWSTAAIAAFALATQKSHKNRWHFLPYFICMGIAFSTKGPVGLLVPLFTGVGWAWAAKKNSGQSQMRIPWLAGMILTLAISLSWFIACSIRIPGLGHYFFQNELVERFFSSKHGRSQPIWFFIPILLLGLLPWTPLVPVLFGRNPGAGPPAASARRALLWWLIPPFILLSLSGSKLITYVLPLLPGLALWMGSRLVQVSPGWKLRVCTMVQQGIFALLAIGSVVMIFIGESKLHIPFSRLALTGSLAAAFIAILASAQLAKRIDEKSVAFLSLSSILLWLTLLLQIPNLGDQLGIQTTLKPLAERIKQDPDWQNAEIMLLGSRGYGLVFYLQQPIYTLEKHADNMLPLSPKVQQRVLQSVADANAVAAASGACYLVIRKRDIPQLQPGQWERLQKEGAFILFKAL